MAKPARMITLGLGVFAVFAGLVTLTLLAGTNFAAPGCTGPAVARCDYIEAAKMAVEGRREFTPDRGFEVFDQGSSVLVQQADPFGPGWLSHASAVWIDKKSCRTCSVGYAVPEPDSDLDPPRGRLLLRTPPEDPVAAATLAEEIVAIERGSPSLDR